MHINMNNKKMGQGEKRNRSIGKGSKACPHDPRVW